MKNPKSTPSAWFEKRRKKLIPMEREWQEVEVSHISIVWGGGGFLHPTDHWHPQEEWMIGGYLDCDAMPASRVSRSRPSLRVIAIPIGVPRSPASTLQNERVKKRDWAPAGYRRSIQRNFREKCGSPSLMNMVLSVPADFRGGPESSRAELELHDGFRESFQVFFFTRTGWHRQSQWPPSQPR